jgi:nucleotide-binding universal stress UspA family protein
MKKILVPIDFSPCAGNALTYALHIAARSGMEITVLHVIFPNDGINNNMYDAFWIDDYIDQRNKDLEDWSKKMAAQCDRSNVPMHFVCNMGFPVSTISETAAAIQASLIIMGTTGATGLKGILLGSTAGGVIGNTQVPVLTVPLESAFKTQAHFVLATDFTFKPDQKSHHALSILLKAHEAQLNVLHVLPEDGTPPVEKEKNVSAHLTDIDHHFHYIHDQDVVNAIDNFMESTQAGVLADVAHKHSIIHQVFFRSISKALAGRLRVPTLILHDA